MRRTAMALCLVLLGLGLLLPAAVFAQKAKTKAQKVKWLDSEVEIVLHGLHDSEANLIGRRDLSAGKRKLALLLYDLSLSAEWQAGLEKAGTLESTMEKLDEALYQCESLQRSSDSAQKKYERCRQKAYPEAFLYFDELCSVSSLWLAVFDLSSQTPRLLGKIQLEELVCDVYADTAMAAGDFDLDGRLEVALSYHHSQPGNDELSYHQLRFVDLDTQQLQFSRALETRFDAGDERATTAFWSFADINDDGFPELRLHYLLSQGSCSFYGTAWSIPDELDDYACTLELEQSVHLYDVSADRWRD